MTGRQWKILLLGIILLACAVFFAGCTTSTTGVKINDTVRIYYSASLPGGKVFETNQNGSPLQFTVGSGKVIEGMELAVIGMTPGETKTVVIPSGQAYGSYNASKVSLLNATNVINNVQKMIQDGQMVKLDYPGHDQDMVFLYSTPDGKYAYIQLGNITNGKITFDENHPLAGKDLQYTIQLVEIVTPTPTPTPLPT